MPSEATSMLSEPMTIPGEPTSILGEAFTMLGEPTSMLGEVCTVLAEVWSLPEGQSGQAKKDPHHQGCGSQEYASVGGQGSIASRFGRFTAGTISKEASHIADGRTVLGIVAAALAAVVDEAGGIVGFAAGDQLAVFNQA